MGIYRGDVPGSLEVLSMPVRVTLPEADAKTRLLLGRQVRPPLDVRFILDTGSRLSGVDLRLLHHLGAPSCGTTLIEGVVGQGPAGLYRIRLEFPSSTLALLPSHVVVGMSLPAKLRADYSGVIGRDLLSRWENLYRGPRHRLTVRDRLSFWGWLCS